MAEIENYTLNFGCGRSLRELDFAFAKSAFTGIQRRFPPADTVRRG